MSKKERVRRLLNSSPPISLVIFGTISGTVLRDENCLSFQYLRNCLILGQMMQILNKLGLNWAKLRSSCDWALLQSICTKLLNSSYYLLNQIPLTITKHEAISTTFHHLKYSTLVATSSHPQENPCHLNHPLTIYLQ